jgi:hypothetical protein
MLLKYFFRRFVMQQMKEDSVCPTLFLCSCYYCWRFYYNCTTNVKGNSSLSVSINNLTHLLAFLYLTICVTCNVFEIFSLSFLFTMCPYDCPFLTVSLTSKHFFLSFMLKGTHGTQLNPHKTSNYVFIWATYDALHAKFRIEKVSVPCEIDIERLFRMKPAVVSLSFSCKRWHSTCKLSLSLSFSICPCNKMLSLSLWLWYQYFSTFLLISFDI